MLLEYTYDNANKVLALFNDGKLATLKITKVSVADNEKFVMDYSFVNSYSVDQQRKMRQVLSDDTSLGLRMRITETLNKFIENMSMDTVDTFTFEYSIVDRNNILCNMDTRFLSSPNVVLSKDINKSIDSLEGIITQMGVGPVKLDNIFRKEGSGKNKRTIQLTVADIIELLRTTIGENE